jgi:hypothetical protein
VQGPPPTEGIFFDMAKKDESDWPELKIEHKRVAKVRGRYCTLKFELSDKAPSEWSEALYDAVASDEEAAKMERNPPPSADGGTISWEVHHDDLETAWRVLKSAVEAANGKYAKLHAARVAKEAEVQSRLEERDKLTKKLDDKFQALK